MTFDPNAQQRPLRPGCGISKSRTEPPFEKGTLGGFVRDEDGNRYILSNAHVLAPNPFKSSGPETRIAQPASGEDGSSAFDFIDQVASWTTHCVLDPSASLLDAGLALIDEAIEVEPTFPRLGRLKGVRDPQIGDRLWMVSKTQGVHSARVAALDVATDIDCFGTTVHFIKQVELVSGNLGGPTMKGDSGGIWVDEGGYACLLNFAGWNYVDPESIPKRLFTTRELEKPREIELDAYDDEGRRVGTMILESNQLIEAKPAQGYGTPLARVLEWAARALGKRCELLL